MKPLFLLAAATTGLLAAGTRVGAQSTARGDRSTEPCFLLALGPAVGAAPVRVAIPAVVALRTGGRIAGASRVSDTLEGGGKPSVGAWEPSGTDSLRVSWNPSWLGGSLELRLARDGGDLRGRYALHGHQADDGRGVARGSAIALQAICTGGRLPPSTERTAAERRLVEWRATQRPETTSARVETRAAFMAFLRATPVHSLSLMNYRIAEFACRRGRPPNSLTELRAARTADVADPGAEWLGDLLWRDAWNRPIQYQRRGLGYAVRSVGPDGQAETADDLVGLYDTIPLKRSRKDGCH